jgi:hypothetical protein
MVFKSKEQKKVVLRNSADKKNEVLKKFQRHLSERGLAG